MQRDFSPHVPILRVFRFVDASHLTSTWWDLTSTLVYMSPLGFAFLVAYLLLSEGQQL